MQIKKVRQAYRGFKRNKYQDTFHEKYTSLKKIYKTLVKETKQKHTLEIKEKLKKY